jgi:hypothetical protein
MFASACASLALMYMVVPASQACSCCAAHSVALAACCKAFIVPIVFACWHQLCLHAGTGVIGRKFCGLLAPCVFWHGLPIFQVATSMRSLSCIPDHDSGCFVANRVLLALRGYQCMRYACVCFQPSSIALRWPSMLLCKSRTALTCVFNHHISTSTWLETRNSTG